MTSLRCFGLYPPALRMDGRATGARSPRIAMRPRSDMLGLVLKEAGAVDYSLNHGILNPLELEFFRAGKCRELKKSQVSKSTFWFLRVYAKIKWVFLTIVE